MGLKEGYRRIEDDFGGMSAGSYANYQFAAAVVDLVEADAAEAAVVVGRFEVEVVIQPFQRL